MMILDVVIRAARCNPPCHDDESDQIYVPSANIHAYMIRPAIFHGTGSSDGEKESQGEVGSKVRVYWY
jgi:hypothetical protein